MNITANRRTPRRMRCELLFVLFVCMTTLSCVDDSLNSGVIPNTEINQADGGDKDWRMYFFTLTNTNGEHHRIYLLATNTPSTSESCSSTIWGDQVTSYQEKTEYWAARQETTAPGMTSKYTVAGNNIVNNEVDALQLDGYQDGCWKNTNCTADKGTATTCDPFEGYIWHHSTTNFILYETSEDPKWEETSPDGSMLVSSCNECSDHYGGFTLTTENGTETSPYIVTWHTIAESDKHYVIDKCNNT